ncbi:MAG: peptidoglycan-binding domain-containing protein [Deltaproteobacteria bacterium]
MKTYLIVTLAAVALFAGCQKKQQALEEMQQPMSPEDLTRLKTQTTETVNVTAQMPALEAQIVSTSGEKMEPLPPSGPFKPTAKEIQLALKNAGFYSGNVDGKLGPMSKKAIEDFQKANGLNADGKVGPKTWAALSTHLTPVPPAATVSQDAKQ